jgi:SAM-dependent methyltransferase
LPARAGPKARPEPEIRDAKQTSGSARARRRRRGGPGAAAAARPQVRVVRSGRGRALRIDGTFASFYTPGRELTGAVWNALASPLAWLPLARRRSVLVLGLGGGSVARVARALAPRARIVGVEMSPEVVRAARRHFGLDALGVEVVLADARTYLERARGRFDLVIEDVFTGRGRAVHKPAWLPRPGLSLAARRVAPGGILTINALDDAPASLRALGPLFPGRVSIAVEDWDNRILVAGPARLSGGALRAALRREPLLAPTLGILAFRSLPRCGAS